MDYRKFGLAAALVLLQSCGGPKSSSTSGPEGGPMATNKMTLWLTVEASDSQVAVVRANLNDGKALATSYRLDGGDFLRACVSGLCRSMADNDSVFAPDYIARFNYQSGVDFVVSFNRQQGQNAPDSRVALPPSFEIVAPANRQPVTDGDTVMVSWAPTGASPADVSLSYDADCTQLSGSHSYSTGTLSSDENRDGRESVRIDPIVSFPNATSPITRCFITVKVSHELRGRVDPAFNHGLARGIVSRTVTLDYSPR